MTRLTAQQAAYEAYDRLLGDQPVTGLFSTGGPFEGFPGPVLVVGRNGVVLSANQYAEPIVKLVQSGASLELKEAVSAALDGKTAQVNPLLTEGKAGSGSRQAFDLFSLPWSGAPAALLLGRDITLERSLRAALIESRQRYKDLVDASSEFAWETDDKGRFTFVSAVQALGYTASELIGRQAAELMVTPDAAAGSPFVTQVPLDGVDVWLRRGDGDPVCLSVIALPLTDASGAWVGVRGQCCDVTEERAREFDLARAYRRERLFAHLLRSVRDEVEAGRMLSSIVDQLLPALGATGVSIYQRGEDFEEVVSAGKAFPKDLLEPLLERIGEGQEEVETSGVSFRVSVAATHYEDACNGALCVWYETPFPCSREDERYLMKEILAQIGAANAQLAREKTLAQLYSTDPLTGLMNRRDFMESGARSLAGAAAAGRSVALFFVDIDNFKQLNDLHGHRHGDQALVLFAKILREQLREEDLAGRIGGDEFGLMIDGITDAAALQRGEALVEAVARLDRAAAKNQAGFTVSVGIAVSDPTQQQTLEALVHRADEAMYSVKQKGRNGVALAASDTAGADA